MVAHGDVAPADRELAASAHLLIAADGGALALEPWRLVPHLVVGDLDSLGDERADALAKQGATVKRFPVAKDHSDLELALGYALESGADEVVLLGIFGGARLDHALVNATLLADPTYRGRGVRAVYGDTQVRALHASDEIALRGPVGSIVTIISLRGDATDVRSRGLRYRLNGDTLPFGKSLGLSNVVGSLPASVSLGNGVALVIEIEEGGAS
ncbi:MAG: thiamine diphosphokinase [Chloroflexota bacterium]|nr:thiamine diphosphokinase [Chloroflexota bacterium]